LTKSISDTDDSFFFCNFCFLNYKSGRNINLFNIFQPIPEVLKCLTSYKSFNKIALCGLYCGTFKSGNYGYWHYNGNISLYKKTIDNLTGTNGLIIGSNQNQVKDHPIQIRDAQIWLANNNHLYKEYFSNQELITGHFLSNNLNSVFVGFPLHDINSIDSGIKTINYNKINLQETGMLVNADDNQNCLRLVGDNNQVKIGVQVPKSSSSMTRAEYIYHNEMDVEAKLFPHLFPHGIGFWVHEYGGLSFAKYARMRLINEDSRWRTDKYYLFYVYDRIIKEKILSVNSMVKSVDKSQIKVKSLKNNDFEEYYKYGNLLPKCITGMFNFINHILFNVCYFF